jgi:hypothetical protein
MKQLLTLSALLFFSITVFGQSPEMFNYQGVARDNSGNVLANQNVGLKFSILTMMDLQFCIRKIG